MSGNELRVFLREKVPHYMVPSVFVQLDSLPLTPNGKVDRKALPAPETNRPKLKHNFVAPRTSVESRLAEIWAEIFSLERVGIYDDFFELGGDSLLAVRMFCEIRKFSSRELPLGTLLRAPTIEQLANILCDEKSSTSWSSLVAFQPEGSKLPFFCVHEHTGNVLCYRDLVHYLGKNQPFYGLQQPRLNGKQACHTRIEDIATEYIKEIRMVQPQGPYLLGGYCFGATVAFEMARQLRAQGQKMALVALFIDNSYAPGYRPTLSNTTSILHKASRVVLSVENHLENIWLLGRRKGWKYMRPRVKRLMKRVKNGINTAARNLDGRKENVGAQYLQGLEDANRQASKNYIPQPYLGRLTLFRARRQPVGYRNDRALGWGELAAGGLEIYEIPGYNAIIFEPRVRVLAKQLRNCLDKYK